MWIESELARQICEQLGAGNRNMMNVIQNNNVPAWLLAGQFLPSEDTILITATHDQQRQAIHSLIMTGCEMCSVF